MGESKIARHRDLGVYQAGYRLALRVHELTQSFPPEEKYELGQQLRRAAVSVPANIAEGYGRKNSCAEFKHFLRNALGSTNEVVVLLSITRDLSYHDDIELIEAYDILGKQIYRLMENWS